MVFVSRKTVLAFCSILFLVLAGTFFNASTAFASSQKSSAAAASPAISGQNDCNGSISSGDVVMVTDNGWDVDCFWNSGAANVGLYDVTAFHTGNYNVQITWLDWNNVSHTSPEIGPGVFMTASNYSSNLFAGYGTIQKITHISMGLGIWRAGSDCSINGQGLKIATNVSGEPWYNVCIDSTGSYGLYEVYAFFTGKWNVTYTYINYNGETLTQTASAFTVVAAGNTTGWVLGYQDIAKITHITLAWA